MEQRKYRVHPYTRRRRRSRRERVLRALERLLPLLLILLAALLSAGVVRVMEVRRPVAKPASSATPTAGAPTTGAASEGATKARVGPSPVEPEDRMLEEVLRASVLDGDAVEEEPERMEPEPLSTGDLYLPEHGRTMAYAMAAVPEPGTLLLLAAGIAWAARGRAGARAARPASGATRSAYRESRVARCRTSGPHPAE